jgi:hypothetical protein
VWRVLVSQSFQHMLLNKKVSGEKLPQARMCKVHQVIWHAAQEMKVLLHTVTLAVGAR